MDTIDINALSEKCKQNVKLFNILIVLLSSCNQNCTHCYIPEHKSHGLPTHIVKRAICEARQLGALNVTLTGGEIFLRSDILELVRYAKKLHMRVFLMSNASLLTEDIIIELKKLELLNFQPHCFL